MPQLRWEPSSRAVPLRTHWTGLTPDELQQINTILKDSGTVTDETLYPLIDLHEPSKAEVLAWNEGDALDRKAMVHYTTDERF